MSRLARAQDGWALITALTVMVIMLFSSLALAAYLDTQTRQGAAGRQRETAFNLAEAALNAQIFSLSRDWPGVGQALNPYLPCTPGIVAARCPSTTTLSALIPSTDAQGATWRTEVRDNNTAATQSYYSDALTAAAPGYDSNGDGRVWVRSQAIAAGHKRTLVALVRIEEQPEDLPHATLITGRLILSNNGNKQIIDASGSSGTSGLVAVRCHPVVNESTPCEGHALGTAPTQTASALDDLLSAQIQPYNVQLDYASGNAMPAEAIARLRARAIADGTYYSSCPPALPTAQVAYIETGNCVYTSNTVVNSATAPGVLLLGSGTLYLGGTVDFWGVVYATNAGGLTGDVVQTQGNAQVHGGVIVDGGGVVTAGSSKMNIALDDNAYHAVESYGSAGLIQNTWREIST